MVLELISSVKGASKITGKVLSLTRGISGASQDVVFRQNDLCAVQSSLDRLSTTVYNEGYSLDRVTQRELVNTLLPPAENWRSVAQRMLELLEEYGVRKEEGQRFRRAVFWRRHKHGVEELRRKAEECKLSLLLAITAAAASVEATHFRTLYTGLCGIHNQLQANHEESKSLMRGLYGVIEGKHEESQTSMQDSNRSRLRYHNEAMKATGEVGEKVHGLVVAVVVAETVTLAVLGMWWYFWRGSVEGKHEEARGWMQDSDRSRMKNHHEALKATMDVGKKVDDLVKGLMVTGVATLVAMAATGLWWYFWGSKVVEKEEAVGSVNKGRVRSSKNEDGQDALMKKKPALKPKPELTSTPKPEVRTQYPVLGIHRDPIQAGAPVAQTTGNIRLSAAMRRSDEVPTNIITNTSIAGTGKDYAKKEEQFADVMTQLKTQLDKKARAEVGVGIGVRVGA